MNLSPQKREHIRWFHRAGLSLLVPVLTFVLAIMSLIMGNESGIGAAMDLDHLEYIKLRLEDTDSKPCFREPYPKPINNAKCNATTRCLLCPFLFGMVTKGMANYKY